MNVNSVFKKPIFHTKMQVWKYPWDMEFAEHVVEYSLYIMIFV